MLCFSKKQKPIVRMLNEDKNIDAVAIFIA